MLLPKTYPAYRPNRKISYKHSGLNPMRDSLKQDLKEFCALCAPLASIAMGATFMSALYALLVGVFAL